MLNCTACIRRALNNLSPNVEFLPSLRFRTYRTRSPGPILFRNHSTLRSIRNGHHRRELLHSIRKPQDTESSGLQPPQKSLKRALLKEKDDVARAHNRTRLLKAPPQYEESILTDRLKLANEVLRLLKKDKMVDALALCRASERSINGAPPINSVVSWNHIIDWLMMRQDTTQAWKVFNEVRKSTIHSWWQCLIWNPYR